MNIKRVAGWTGAAFMMWFVIARPDGAASTLRSMGNMMQSAAEGMSSFMTALF